MKNYLKKAASLLLAALCVFGLAIPAAAADQKVEVPELKMEISVPSDWVTFTRDIAEDDPNLEALGLSRDDIYNQYTSSNIYLNSIRMSPMSELVVTMVENEGSKEIFDFSKMSEKKLQEMGDEMVKSDEMKANGATYTNPSTYKQAEVNFLVFDLTMNTSGLTTQSKQYYTMVNGQAINFVLHNYDGAMTAEDEQILKTVVDSIHFTEILPNPNKDSISTVVLIGGIVVVVAVLVVIAAAVSGKKKKQKMLENMNKNNNSGNQTDNWNNGQM